MKKLLMIMLLSLLFGTTSEAKEVEILMGESFIDSLSCKPNEFEEEVIVETKDVLIGYFNLTAYCACSSCCGSSTGITASGARVQPKHTIAADTRVLSFGTVVYINGEDYTVEDTGSAIKGNCIDIYFGSHSEARAFGRDYEKVYMRKEVEKVLVPVSFIEYINISGDFMQKNIAESKRVDSIYCKAFGNSLLTNKLSLLTFVDNSIDMPSEFIDMLTYVRNLQFNEVPNYNVIRDKLNNIIQKNQSCDCNWKKGEEKCLSFSSGMETSLQSKKNSKKDNNEDEKSFGLLNQSDIKNEYELLFEEQSDIVFY